MSESLAGGCTDNNAPIIKAFSCGAAILSIKQNNTNYSGYVDPNNGHHKLTFLNDASGQMT